MATYNSYNFSAEDYAKLPANVAVIISQHAEKLKKQREYSRTYYYSHIEECRERNRTYRENNKEKYKEYSRNYYHNHIEECRERNREYYHKKKNELNNALSLARAILGEQKMECKPAEFKVDVPYGGSNSNPTNEDQYQEMKKSGQVNCSFESFKTAKQMIELGNSVINGGSF